MMKIPVDFINSSSDSKDCLLVDKKVGKGKFAVYYARSEKRPAEFALKAFPKEPNGIKQYYKELAVTALDHENLIKFYPITSQKSGYNFILTEYAPHGDFFEFVQNLVFRDEVIIRTYFRQLIEGIEYIHSQGFAHLDLKLENIMLGKDYLLKIIDFDQAQSTSDKVLQSGGTVGYRAPEVRAGKCTYFEGADLYSAGIILYALKTKEYPFVETGSKNNTRIAYYNVFLEDNKAFWRMKAEKKGDKAFFSDEFKSLINGMLAADPSRRFKIKDIMASRWYNGPVIDKVVLNEKMRSLRSMKK